MTKAVAIHYWNERRSANNTWRGCERISIKAYGLEEVSPSIHVGWSIFVNTRNRTETTSWDRWVELQWRREE